MEEDKSKIIPKVELNDDNESNKLTPFEEQIDEGLEKELQKASTRQFSGKAYILLKQKIEGYISELIRESIRNAERENLDSVSATHIEKASNYLISSSRGKVNKIVSSIGGVLLGATLSNVVNMILKGGDTSIGGIVTTVVLGIIGAFLLAYSYNR